MVTVGGAGDNDAVRGRILVEESREIVVILDQDDRVIQMSRRAREVFPDLSIGRRMPGPVRDGRRSAELLEVPYTVGDHTEKLVYIGRPGDLHAYEELRAGFTAAVSHELRTPLARLLALAELLELPGSDPLEIADRARAEVGQMGELIDDVLFLSELETGHEVVGLGACAVLPEIEAVVHELHDRTTVAGITVSAQGDPTLQVAVRPRMLRVLALNLIENAIRYAGDGASLEFDVGLRRGMVEIRARDSGVGVSDEALARLFERFFRTDSARTTRGTGLGLAIVKHVCASADGYAVAEHSVPHGLTVRLRLPDATPERD
jgi:signal transduction histidine kinase